MTLLNQQMSQIAINFRQKVVDDYLMKLAAARKVQQTEVVESSDDKVELTCFTLDPNHKLPKGFTLSTSQKGKENLKHEELQYQYDLRSVAEVKGRPKANRVPFFNIAEVFGDKQRTVSHLCHNSWCMNPRHFVMETLWQKTRAEMGVRVATFVCINRSASDQAGFRGQKRRWFRAKTSRSLNCKLFSDMCISGRTALTYSRER